jgi:gamma-glutamylcysteine synthetase
VQDSASGRTVGARKPGKRNDTVASCETGYCKTEFSLAHVADLFDLQEAIADLREDLLPFAQQNDVLFLGYGIHPVSPPGADLAMNKSRTGVWDKVFGSNRHIPEEKGDDFHLFTINAASHVHVSARQEEAVPAVNVLNGFAAAQIALTAHSSIWRGRIDPEYRCVAEKFWDWWMPDGNRVGVPEKCFEDLRDYVRTVARLRPVFVRRQGRPVVLRDYESFARYFGRERALGKDLQGREVQVRPRKEDLELHNTCYWYNARISRHYTVENRVNDQQPPEELPCIAALTLGLMSALPEADREVSRYRWSDLRQARDSACRHGLEGRVGDMPLSRLAGRMLDLAEHGLRGRGLGEEAFLEPLKQRLSWGVCPAQEADEVFRNRGIEAFLEQRRL